MPNNNYKMSNEENQFLVTIRKQFNLKSYSEISNNLLEEYLIQCAKKNYKTVMMQLTYQPFHVIGIPTDYDSLNIDNLNIIKRLAICAEGRKKALDISDTLEQVATNNGNTQIIDFLYRLRFDDFRNNARKYVKETFENGDYKKIDLICEAFREKNFDDYREVMDKFFACAHDKTQHSNQGSSIKDIKNLIVLYNFLNKEIKLSGVSTENTPIEDIKNSIIEILENFKDYNDKVLSFEDTKMLYSQTQSLENDNKEIIIAIKKFILNNSRFIHDNSSLKDLLELLIVEKNLDSFKDYIKTNFDSLGSEHLSTINKLNENLNGKLNDVISDLSGDTAEIPTDFS